MVGFARVKVKVQLIELIELLHEYGFEPKTFFVKQAWNQKSKTLSTERKSFNILYLFSLVNWGRQMESRCRKGRLRKWCTIDYFPGQNPKVGTFSRISFYSRDSTGCPTSFSPNLFNILSANFFWPGIVKLKKLRIVKFMIPEWLF